jgi:hypothetical protein
MVKVLQVKSNGGIGNEIKGLPRMADFAETGEIISRCVGNEKNKFLDAYYRNIDIQIEEAIASNPVGNAIIKLLERLEAKTCSYVTIKEDCNSSWCSLLWKGTATELLSDLESVAAELKINTRHKPWPKAPNSLSRRINEVKTNLREIGIVIDNGVRDSKTKVKTIEIRKIPSLSSISLPDKNQAQITGDIGNDINCKLTRISSTDTISLPKTLQNYAQNDTGNDSHNDNDILHTLQGPFPDYPVNCYYCDYKPDSKDHYERHVILRHDHCIAYPNKAEIEKLRLEAQGKSWET